MYLCVCVSSSFHYQYIQVWMIHYIATLDLDIRRTQGLMVKQNQRQEVFTYFYCYSGEICVSCVWKYLSSIISQNRFHDIVFIVPLMLKNNNNNNKKTKKQKRKKKEKKKLTNSECKLNYPNKFWLFLLWYPIQCLSIHIIKRHWEWRYLCVI